MREKNEILLHRLIFLVEKKPNNLELISMNSIKILVIIKKTSSY